MPDVIPARHEHARLVEEIASHRNYLYRLAHLQLRDAAGAEDATQEALLAALESLATFAGRSSLKTWLVSILRFKVLDALRRRARTTRLMAPEGEEEADATLFDGSFDAEGTWTEPMKDWNTPESALQRADFMRVLDACLTRLPERTSRAFLMREWLEVSSDEICAELGLSPVNLRVLLYRARMQLRSCLDVHWS